MDEKELKKAWQKILKRSCLGDFNCMISTRNPFYKEGGGSKCPFLVECENVASRNSRKMGLRK